MKKLVLITAGVLITVAVIVVFVLMLGALVRPRVALVGLPAPMPPPTPVVIQHIPESEIPQLTEAEETKVQGMVFSDVRVRELIGKRRYTIESIGVWINTKHQKIGGFVEISFDEPFFADYNWPVIDCDVEKYGEAYYREGTVHEALWVKKLNIRVDLQKGKVVDITPLPFG